MLYSVELLEVAPLKSQKIAKLEAWVAFRCAAGDGLLQKIELVWAVHFAFHLDAT